ISEYVRFFRGRACEDLIKEPSLYFYEFGIEDKLRGHRRYIRLLQTSTLGHELRKKLMSDFKVWKVDKAPQYWLSRRARLSSINTATKLVEGSEPFVEEAIVNSAAQASSSLSSTYARSDSTSSSSERIAQTFTVLPGIHESTASTTQCAPERGTDSHWQKQVASALILTASFLNDMSPL
ncbi:hypothetical protein BGX27_005024, partial [Mortierella sp. AM989]